MPRGEPTRVISIRIPETLAAAVDEQMQRIGKTVGDAAQEVLLDTFRYPGSKYSWKDAKEREKIIRQVAELRAANAALVKIVLKHDPTFAGLTTGRVAIPEEREITNWFAEMKETHRQLDEQMHRRIAARERV